MWIWMMIFQHYERDKVHRLGVDSVIPQRIKYKSFQGSG